LTGCSGKQATSKQFTLLDSAATGIVFSNNVSYNESFNPYTFRNFFNGAGVGIGDINNDGLADIFFCSNQSTGKLYLNKGSFRFEDITTAAGINTAGAWSTGVSMVDVNGDGLLDIYVCKSGDSNSVNRNNSLYINKTIPGSATPRFEDEAKQYGLDVKGLSTHAAFFDLDNDGDLDCYLLTNSFRSVSNFTLVKDQRTIVDSLGGNRLFRNDDGHFTDITKSAGIYSSIVGFGLGVTISDLNKDGWQDIYVSNDFFERDYLYLNNGKGGFVESAEKLINEMSLNSMGADIADINNDGYPEIYVTDMLPKIEARLKTKTSFEDWDKYQSNLQNGYYHQFARNTLQLNMPVSNGRGDSSHSLLFSEIGRLAGVQATDWSWGALINDFDNDGYKDIFVANGIYKDITDQDYIQFTNGAQAEIRNQVINKEKNIITRLIDQIPSAPVANYLFRNNGKLGFDNMSATWGLDQLSFSNGSAYGDLDNDGDADLVVNNMSQPCFLYRNESRQLDSTNQFLSVALTGADKNSSAIGAKVIVYHSGGIFYQEQMPMRGFQSSVNHRLLFGLGKIKEIDSVVVIWPRGKYSVIHNPPTNQQIAFSEKNSEGIFDYNHEPIAASIYPKVAATDIRFVHKENKFIDFDRDRLIFQMLSTQGPHIATSDIDGNGLQYVFIGGAHGQPAAIFQQQAGGRFLQTNHSVLAADSMCEDTDAIFFDADNDGDQDLYVCSGGNEFSPNSTALINRLYINDGKGNFSRSPQILPSVVHESTSCVRAADFDHDGDLDLFVGVRLRPFSYGLPCKSYMLINDGKGQFSDATKALAPALESIGMVTDAQWLDYDKDGWMDLAIAGEYMPVTIFKNINGRLEPQTLQLGLDNSNGWWNRILVADLNNDGYPDLVAANHGLNSRFRADSMHPVSMYVNDFDKNGTLEQIITCYNGDSSFPVLLRHDLVAVLPYLKKKYLKYNSYKEQRVEDIFDPSQLASAKKFDAFCMESSVFLNQSGKKFSRYALPMPAQTSSMFAILVTDYDNDGNEDLLLGGNIYEVKPEAGIQVASTGCLLKGDGKGGFVYIAPSAGGPVIRGAVRDLKILTNGGEKLLLVAKNNAAIEVRNAGIIQNNKK
ncbi:MAG: VCBS repeat-containing protein, partial [Flavitalea sp.]